MKTMDLIRFALELSNANTSRLVADLHDLPLTRTTSRVGNHALWILGHLAVVEGSVPKILFGEPNPVEHWWPLFGQGTTPMDDALQYPTFDELLASYRDLRAKNVARLEEIGEDGLELPPKAVPPGFENEMRTIGRTLLVITLHQMFHLGQVADVRRAAGKQPLI